MVEPSAFSSAAVEDIEAQKITAMKQADDAVRQIIQDESDEDIIGIFRLQVRDRSAFRACFHFAADLLDLSLGARDICFRGRDRVRGTGSDRAWSAHADDLLLRERAVKAPLQRWELGRVIVARAATS